jgi:hypothetical protein
MNLDLPQPRPLTDTELARLREKPMRLDGIKARLIATIDQLKKQKQPVLK